MSNKIAGLVVPIKIDTSAIAAGVKKASSLLRGLRGGLSGGGSYGGGGAGGGFGSGVQPYGGVPVNAGGPGVSVSAGSRNAGSFNRLPSMVAARDKVARMRMNGAEYPPGSLRDFKQGTNLARNAALNFGVGGLTRRKAKKALADIIIGNERKRLNPEIDGLEALMEQDLNDQAVALGRKKYSEIGKRRRQAVREIAMNRFKQSVVPGAKAVLGSAVGQYFGISGAIGAIKGAANFRNKMEGEFSDVSKFQGGEYQNRANAMSAQYANNKDPNFYQAMMLGGRSEANPEQQSGMENIGQALYESTQGFGQAIGAGVDSLMSTSLFAGYRAAMSGPAPNEYKRFVLPPSKSLQRAGL